MRVLVVTQYYWPETFRITEVSKALSDEGCEVIVLTGHPNYPDGKTFDGYSWWTIKVDYIDGITVMRVPLFPRGSGTAIYLTLNYLSFILSAAIIGPILLRRHSIDRVFVFGLSPILQAIPAIWIAYLKNTPLIIWVQDIWPDSLSVSGFVRNNTILKVVSNIVGWIYKKSDTILVQSPAFVKSIKKVAENISVKYHPNPGDFGFEVVSSEKATVMLNLSEFNVIFAGNMGTVQALGTIIEAAEILRGDLGLSFIMVGSGSRIGWLKSETAARDLKNIQFVDRLPLSCMPSIMSQASALLVTLISDPVISQTIPSKVQAYLAAGKPIIGSLDGEGARAILEAGAGIVVPAENAPRLAGAVRDLRSKSKDELNIIGKNGRLYYERNFEPRLLAKRLVKILEETEKKGS